MDVLCLKCKGKMFTKNVLDEEGHFAMDPDDGLPLESEEGKSFFVCPNCGAKNIVVEATSKDGPPQIRISHVED